MRFSQMPVCKQCFECCENSQQWGPAQSSITAKRQEETNARSDGPTAEAPDAFAVLAVALVGVADANNGLRDTVELLAH